MDTSLLKLGCRVKIPRVGDFSQKGYYIAIIKEIRASGVKGDWILFNAEGEVIDTFVNHLASIRHFKQSSWVLIEPKTFEDFL